ncbi:hypothetical protein ACVGOW_24115 [Pseudonocardia saturnea]
MSRLTVRWGDGIPNSLDCDALHDREQPGDKKGRQEDRGRAMRAIRDDGERHGVTRKTPAASNRWPPWQDDGAGTEVASPVEDAAASHRPD